MPRADRARWCPPSRAEGRRRPRRTCRAPRRRCRPTRRSCRHADVVQPVARPFVQPGGRHRRRHPAAGAGRDDLDARQRVHAAVGQGGAHDGQVPCGHLQGALLGVDVGGLQGVEGQPALTLQQTGDAAVALVGGGLGLVHRDVEFEPPPRERGQTGLEERPLGHRTVTGTRLVVTRAPALTIGFIGDPAFSSSAMTAVPRSRPCAPGRSCRRHSARTMRGPPARAPECTRPISSPNSVSLRSSSGGTGSPGERGGSSGVPGSPLRMHVTPPAPLRLRPSTPRVRAPDALVRM